MNLVDKNKEIDKIASKKFVHEKIKDKEFRDIAEKGIDMCLDDLKEHGDEYQKYSEIPKDKCNIKFDYFTDCLTLEMFMVNFKLRNIAEYYNFVHLEMSQKRKDHRY